jgi:LEA14-like dessication related protein
MGEADLGSHPASLESQIAWDILKEGLDMRQRIFMMVRTFIPVFLLAGCAHLLGPADSPRVNIAGLTPKDMKLFEQIFVMELRVMNPGDKELVINGLAFNVEVNGQAFARGVSNESFRVGPFASHVVQVEAVTTLGSLLRQIVQAQKGEFSGFTYHLKGYFNSGPSASRIPFDETGEFKPSP